jgi:phosphate transport system protein
MNSLTEPGLNQLRDNVLLIGGEVGRAVEQATQALILRDAHLAERVLAENNRIDALELESDQFGICVLALRAPKARDLRFVIAVSKITSCLELVGDYACNLARAAIDLNNQPPVRIQLYLPQIAQKVSQTLYHSLIAFMEADATAARTLIEHDDETASLYDRLFQDLLDDVVMDPDTAGQAASLVLMANTLLQVGNCAREVCRQVIYMKEACLIRYNRPERVARPAATGAVRRKQPW